MPPPLAIIGAAAIIGEAPSIVGNVVASPIVAAKALLLFPTPSIGVSSFSSSFSSFSSEEDDGEPESEEDEDNDDDDDDDDDEEESFTGAGRFLPSLSFSPSE